MPREKRRENGRHLVAHFRASSLALGDGRESQKSGAWRLPALTQTR
jgi:hypothetical protein